MNLDEINDLKAIKVTKNEQILLPGVVVFVFMKFQRDLSTCTSSDLAVRFNFVKTKTTTPGNNIIHLIGNFYRF